MAASRDHWLNLANHTYTLTAFLAACLVVPSVIALCIGKHVNSMERVPNAGLHYWFVVWGFSVQISSGIPDYSN
jgi:hypothetical protein